MEINEATASRENANIGILFKGNERSTLEMNWRQTAENVVLLKTGLKNMEIIFHCQIRFLKKLWRCVGGNLVTGNIFHSVPCTPLIKPVFC